LGGTSILLVETDHDTAEMYAVGLDIAGYTAVIADDPADAARRLHDDPPRVVVAEVQAAARDDWQLIRTLRADAATAAVPVVMLTGRTDSDIRSRAREFHCAALVLKPCLPDELARILQRVLLSGAVLDVDWEPNAS
jgi:DNA-binding response OmpR family regulator